MKPNFFSLLKKLSLTATCFNVLPESSIHFISIDVLCLLDSVNRDIQLKLLDINEFIALFAGGGLDDDVPSHCDSSRLSLMR